MGTTDNYFLCTLRLPTSSFLLGLCNTKTLFHLGQQNPIIPTALSAGRHFRNQLTKQVQEKLFNFLNCRQENNSSELETSININHQTTFFYNTYPWGEKNHCFQWWHHVSHQGKMVPIFVLLKRWKQVWTSATYIPTCTILPARKYAMQHKHQLGYTYPWHEHRHTHPLELQLTIVFSVN